MEQDVPTLPHHRPPPSKPLPLHTNTIDEHENNKNLSNSNTANHYARQMSDSSSPLPLQIMKDSTSDDNNNRNSIRALLRTVWKVVHARGVTLWFTHCLSQAVLYTLLLLLSSNSSIDDTTLQLWTYQLLLVTIMVALADATNVRVIAAWYAGFDAAESCAVDRGWYQPWCAVLSMVSVGNTILLILPRLLYATTLDYTTPIIRYLLLPVYILGLVYVALITYHVIPIVMVEGGYNNDNCAMMMVSSVQRSRTLYNASRNTTGCCHYRGTLLLWWLLRVTLNCLSVWSLTIIITNTSNHNIESNANETNVNAVGWWIWKAGLGMYYDDVTNTMMSTHTDSTMQHAILCLVTTITMNVVGSILSAVIYLDVRAHTGVIVDNRVFTQDQLCAELGLDSLAADITESPSATNNKNSSTMAPVPKLSPSSNAASSESSESSSEYYKMKNDDDSDDRNVHIPNVISFDGV